MSFSCTVDCLLAGWFKATRPERKGKVLNPYVLVLKPPFLVLVLEPPLSP